MIEWAQAWGCDGDWLSAARDGFVPLLGAAGVVITLGYLAVQIRQNTASLRAASLQALAELSRRTQVIFFTISSAHTFALGSF